ncbi:MAG: hypothetical protein E6J74_29485 [Deltaproteobacteria bacterium]|nr:MAG: hypothetical protein E6J74_29485 [Deltaproteobacteria bacterium]
MESTGTFFGEPAGDGSGAVFGVMPVATPAILGFWTNWLELLVDRYDMAEITTLLNPRSQNVPKTKAEGMKPLEITKGRKKFVRVKNTV